MFYVHFYISIRIIFILSILLTLVVFLFCTAIWTFLHWIFLKIFFKGYLNLGPLQLPIWLYSWLGGGKKGGRSQEESSTRIGGDTSSSDWCTREPARWIPKWSAWRYCEKWLLCNHIYFFLNAKRRLFSWGAMAFFWKLALLWCNEIICSLHGGDLGWFRLLICAFNNS